MEYGNDDAGPKAQPANWRFAAIVLAIMLAAVVAVWFVNWLQVQRIGPK